MSLYERIRIPGTNTYITPGCRVKLGRFDTTLWIVSFGWVACDGNRPVCAWYLTDCRDIRIHRLLQLTDLDDIYLIES